MPIKNKVKLTVVPATVSFQTMIFQKSNQHTNEPTMNNLTEWSLNLLQNITLSTTNIVVFVGVLTLAIAILRANEISFRFKDLIEIILKK